jgi:hypothetical protein
MKQLSQLSLINVELSAGCQLDFLNECENLMQLNLSRNVLNRKELRLKNGVKLKVFKAESSELHMLDLIGLLPEFVSFIFKLEFFEFN